MGADGSRPGSGSACGACLTAAFVLSEVEATLFPSPRHVSDAFAQLGLVPESFESCVKTFASTRPRSDSRGYQVDLAVDLVEHLGQGIVEMGIPAHTRGAAMRYSAVLREKADLVFGDPSGTRGFVEVEFRPNVEKDLIKFQIGHNAGRLAVAVLLVALDRRQINPSYTTMPEYTKVVRVVTELHIGYPLVVVGVGAARATT